MSILRESKAINDIVIMISKHCKNLVQNTWTIYVLFYSIYNTPIIGIIVKCLQLVIPGYQASVW